MIKMFFLELASPVDLMLAIKSTKFILAQTNVFRVSDYEPGQPLFKVTEKEQRSATIDEVATNDATTSGEILEDAQGTLDKWRNLFLLRSALQKKKGQIDMRFLRREIKH